MACCESGWRGNTTHITKGNEHFRFTQPHLHIVGFIICTRAGVLKLAPIYTAFLYQGEAKLESIVILFVFCGRESYSCRCTHTQ